MTNTWKVAAFILALLGASGAAAQGSLQPNSKTLCGTMNIAFVDHEVCIAVDVVNYGSGTSHKGYIVKQYQGGAATSVTPADLGGVKITGCQFDNGGTRGFKIKYAATDKAKINGTTAMAGGAPSITCNAKKGNGSQPPENYATFTMN